MSPSPLKQVVTVERLPRHQMTPDFFSWSLRGQLGGEPLDPFLNLDDFHMAEPTFPPHPHAGFSAVTYLFEDSKGAFVNRDSRGNHQRIGPGALHWTEAASGVMHEEIPAVAGIDSHGLQMFVNLPAARHLAEPRALHLDAAQVTEVSPSPGARVRVLAGEAAGARSSLDVVPDITFLDLHLAPGATFELPAREGQTAFGFAIAGQGRAGGTAELAEHQAVLFDRRAGRLLFEASASPLQVLVGVGTPLHQPVLWSGPFALTSRSALEDAHRRFARGDMGRLAPSR